MDAVNINFNVIGLTRLGIQPMSTAPETVYCLDSTRKKIENNLSYLFIQTFGFCNQLIIQLEISKLSVTNPKILEVGLSHFSYVILFQRNK